MSSDRWSSPGGAVAIPGVIGSVQDIVGRDKIEIRSGQATPVPVPSEQAPANFIERPELTDGVLGFLLSDAPSPRGRAMISALHGLGGVGKTTVARWLIWRPEVEARFPDGRIWVTLGSEPPNALTVLNEVAGRLDATLMPKTTLESARADLSAVLRQRSVMLVIDDVWPGESLDVAAALLVPSSRSRFLLTTRFPNLGASAEVRAVSFALDEMSEVQGCALVATVLGRELEPAEADHARQLCAHVGGHPMALELAAAQVREGRPWRSLLSDLAAEIARLHHLADADDGSEQWLISRGEGGRKRRSVEGTLLLSVRYLNARGRELFAWLGIAPEDAVITPAMTATLWSLEVELARRHLRALNEAGLLRAVEGGYQLHDLMLDLARGLLAAPTAPLREGDLPGFGTSLQEATARLLQRYGDRRRAGLWHTLADDGYIHQQLVYHLGVANDSEALGALLWEEDEAGCCGWYEVRQALGQLPGFLADVRRIWLRADQAWGAASTDAEIARALSLQLHCALITTSISSLSAAIPNDVLAGAVRYGILSFPTALALIRQLPDPAARALALVHLLDLAPPDARLKLLEESCTAIKGYYGASLFGWRDTLAAMLRRLPPATVLLLAKPIRQLENTEAILKEAEERHAAELIAPKTWGERLQLARETADPVLCAQELVALSDLASLPRNLLQDTVRRLMDAGEMIGAPEAMAQLAARSPPEQRLEILSAAREKAQALGERRLRAGALATVARQLPEDRQLEAWDEAMVFARSVDGAVRRTVAMAEVIQSMPPAFHEVALRETLAHARAIDDPVRKRSAVRQVLGLLPPDLLPTLVDGISEACREIDDPRDRASVLMAAAHRTSGDARAKLAQHSLAWAREIKDGDAQAKALALLARRIPTEAQLGTVGEMLASGRWAWRAKTGVMLTRTLPIERVVSLALNISEPRERARVLTLLAGRLPVESARTVVQKIPARHRAKALAELARRLPAEAARTVAKQIDEPHERARALARIVPFLRRRAQPSAIEEVLGSARLVSDPWLRATTLVQVAGRFPEEVRTQFYAEALASTQAAPRWQRTEILTQVARLLPPAVGLEVARAIARAQHRSETLLRLAGRLPQHLRLEIVNEAITAAETVDDSLTRIGLLTKAARYLPEARRPAALSATLEAARSMEESILKAEALAIVARRLPAGMGRVVFLEAIATARSLQGWQELELVERVMARLPAELVHHLVPNLGRDMSGTEVRTEQFRLATRSLTPRQALAFARGIDRPEERARLIVEAARRLRDPERRGALADALENARELASLSNGPPVLLQLARRLPTGTPTDLLKLLADVARSSDELPLREQILAEVARRLPASEPSDVIDEISDAWRRLRVRCARDARAELAGLRSDWADAVRSVSQHERKRCLQGLGAVAPVIEMLGGRPSLESLARSISCVGRWWP